MSVETAGCRLLARAGSHPGYVRERNEDAVLSLPEAGLWAVADGMGGHARGDLASRSIVEALRSLGEGCAGTTLVERLPGVAQQVNRVLHDEAASLGGGAVIGSTLAALVLEDEHYHCYWAGDSRVYRWRGDELQRLTRDHAEAVDPLAPSGGEVLTRAVGAEPRLELDYVAGYLYQGDGFLLCSDGLTKVLDDVELAALLAGCEPAQAVSVLIRAALERGAPDNVSCVTVCLTDEE